MPDYTLVSASAADPGAPWISTVAFAALFNADAIAQGAAGATRVQTAALEQGAGVQAVTNETVRDSDIEFTKLLRLVGDMERASGNGSVTGYPFSKIKEWRIGVAGWYRLNLGCYVNGYSGHVQVYKGGVAYGTNRTTSSTSWVYWSEDLYFEAGELCQLYCGQNDHTSYITYGSLSIRAGDSIDPVNTL